MNKGDILPVLYKAGLTSLIEPITALHNSVVSTGIWPKRWKRRTPI